MSGSKKSVPRKESKKSVTKPTEEEAARLYFLPDVVDINLSLSLCSSTNVVKTTMTVRLHPGNVEEQQQEKEVEEEVEEVEEELEVEQQEEEDTGELTDTLA